MKKVYYNGEIITVNDEQPVADAILIEDGKIVAVGEWENMQHDIDDATEKIDLQHNVVLPGFIDGHGHVGNPAASVVRLDPPPNGDIDSKEKLIQHLKKAFDDQRILENGWFVAMGYDNVFFENRSHPTKDDLDQVSKETPILILHASGGHMGVVNSKALEIVGWDEHTENPEGGVIQRDPITGALNGILEEKAVKYVAFNYVLKNLGIESLGKMFENTQKYYASKGVTTAQEGGTISKALLQMLQYCQQTDRLMMDVGVYPLQENISEVIPDQSEAQQYVKHLKICGAKVVGDGSPQAKTAWLTAPYYVKPENTEEGYRGYSVYSDEKMLAFCKQALEHDWQILVHCNGDAMADQFIRSYRQAQQETGNTKNLRPVMIHAQTVREDQLDAMKELGIMPSFFNDHVFYWGDYYVESILGPERAQRISPLASAVKRGMPFTLHNDMPVTPVNPILNIHNAVNRTTRSGQVLGKEFCVDAMEAIKAVTIYGAYQYFDEQIKGSLEEGKLADMVILDKNPLHVPKEAIKDIRVLETIKEGNTIYKA